MHALYAIHIVQKYPADNDSIGGHCLDAESRQHYNSYITLPNIPWKSRYLIEAEWSI